MNNSPQLNKILKKYKLNQKASKTSKTTRSP